MPATIVLRYDRDAGDGEPFTARLVFEDGTVADVGCGRTEFEALGRLVFALHHLLEDAAQYAVAVEAAGGLRYDDWQPDELATGGDR